MRSGARIDLTGTGLSGASAPSRSHPPAAPRAHTQALDEPFEGARVTQTQGPAAAARLRHGVNLSHWFSQVYVAPGYSAAHYDSYMGQSDLELIAAQGFDHVRFPIAVEHLVEADGSRLDREFVARIEREIDQLHALGLAVIVDAHPEAEFKNDLARSDDAVERFVIMWSNLAARFADSDPASVVADGRLVEHLERCRRRVGVGKSSREVGPHAHEPLDRIVGPGKVVLELGFRVRIDDDGEAECVQLVDLTLDPGDELAVEAGPVRLDQVLHGDREAHVVETLSGDQLEVALPHVRVVVRGAVPGRHVHLRKPMAQVHAVAQPSGRRRHLCLCHSSSFERFIQHWGASAVSYTHLTLPT